MNRSRIPELRLRARTWLVRSGVLVCLGVLALDCADADDDANVGHGDGNAGQGGRDAAALAPVPAPPPPSACDRASLAPLRIEAWPGGGLQIALAAQSEDGAARGLAGEPLRLLRADGEAAAVVVHAHEQSAGLTALLFVPSADPAVHARRIEAARAFASALPAAERIALYLLQPGVPLAAELSERRAHLFARLSALAPEPSAWPLRQALAQVGGALRRVASAWGPIARNLVVIGAQLDAAQTGADTRTPLLRDGLLHASLAAPGEDESAAPLEGARALAARIAEQRGAVALLGACGPFAIDEPLALELELDGARARCELRAPPALAEWQDASCDDEAAAVDAYPFAESIELELGDDQLALHDAYAAAKVESDFAVQLRVNGSAPIAASAHFRGQTTLDCERKSYSVNLKGSRARRFAPGFAADELYLISMCNETHYFYQVVASKMMRALGVFPLDHRYVRLHVAGRDLGVYLLLEKPEDTLRVDQLALSAVVRRRLEGDNHPPEAKFPNDAAGAERALGEYLGLAAHIDALAPDQLAADLAERVDLDGYLDWLAFNAYLQCGDSADEAFFYASSERAADGTQHAYFRHHGWDADDLFRDCHFDGEFAIVDPAGLLYCAESDLDRALIAAPEIHARFVDALDRMIAATLPPERVLELLAETRSELFAQLQDEAACSAMVELIAAFPEATDCAQLRAIIDQGISAFDTALRARASELQALIAAQRGRP